MGRNSTANFIDLNAVNAPGQTQCDRCEAKKCGSFAYYADSHVRRRIRAVSAIGKARREKTGCSTSVLEHRAGPVDYSSHPIRTQTALVRMIQQSERRFTDYDEIFKLDRRDCSLLFSRL